MTINWMELGKWGINAVVGSGFTALSGKLLGPTINNLKGYQKFAGWCAAGALSMYLADKTAEHIFEGIEEFHAKWVEAQNEKIRKQKKEVKNLEPGNSGTSEQQLCEQGE